MRRSLANSAPWVGLGLVQAELQRDHHTFGAPFDRVAVSQLCGLLRKGKGTGDAWRRIAPVREELRNELNKSEHGATSDRSTNYGSGHLIQVFRDIGRIFSSLLACTWLLLGAPPCRHPLPVAHWSSARDVAFNAEGEIWFRRRQETISVVFDDDRGRYPDVARRNHGSRPQWSRLLYKSSIWAAT